MDPIRAALAPVLRDVAATTDVRLTVGDLDLTEARRPLIWISGTGVSANLDDSESELIRSVAEQVQEIVIEELWSRASNWPMCSAHRSSHPLQTVLAADGAWWVCPADSSQVARIGDLTL